MVTTQPAGQNPAGVSSRLVYTAFGERVWSDGTIGTRYQYAGACGYQTMPEYAGGFSNGLGGEPGDAVPFVHVGHRWYDPASGRFLQRDPIGIGGGLNVYGYVKSSPIKTVDASGFGGFVTGGGIEGRIRDCREPDDPRPQLPPLSWDLPSPGPPSPGPSPQQELGQLRKTYFFVNGTIVCGAKLHWAIPVGQILAAVVDQIIHWDEPLNPIFGGTYEDWYREP